MSIKVAVTGASGHIGNVVCRFLIERGYAVKAFYHSDANSLKGLNLELVQGDILHLQEVSDLVQSCDYVVHCAANISIDGDKSGKLFRINTEGPANVLTACKMQGVKKIIHVSSVHAVCDLPHHTSYDENRPYKQAHDFVYDYSKAHAEQILMQGAENQGLEVVIVRPSCVLGPFDYKPSLLGAALLNLYHAKFPIIPQGGYDMVDVRDVAASICEAIQLGKNGEVYLLSGRYFTFREILQFLFSLGGKKRPFVILPFWLLKASLPLVYCYGKLTGSTPPITCESIAAIEEAHPQMNNSKAKKILNHTNRPMQETLKDFLTWIENHHKNKLV